MLDMLYLAVIQVTGISVEAISYFFNFESVIPVGVMGAEAFSTDGLWLDYSRNDYLRVAGDCYDSKSCGMSYIDLHRTTNTGTWNIGIRWIL